MNRFLLFVVDQEIVEIQRGVKHLQKTFMDVQCDLIVQEFPTINIDKSIDCDLIWTHSTSAFTPVSTRKASIESPMKSPRNDEENVRFFLIDSDDDERENKDQAKSSSKSPTEELSPIIVINSDKKYKIKKLCKNCGHYLYVSMKISIDFH